VEDNEKKDILKELASMNKSLQTLSENMVAFEGRVETALAETNGKLKGNHELITQELHMYVHKDRCETHRTDQNNKVTDIETRLKEVEYNIKQIKDDKISSKNVVTDIIIAWGPGIAKTAVLVTMILVVLSKGWINLGG